MNSAGLVELDREMTDIGELILRRRLVRSLDNLEVYEVKLGHEFLMSSLFHAAESELGMRAVQLFFERTGGAHPEVAVGGLGLGYTAAAALEAGAAGITVVEMLAPVIRWHRDGLVPLGITLAEDRRCRLVEADFFDLQWEMPRRYDAILVDIDHSPDLLLSEAHRRFYSEAGLRRLCKRLKPEGIFGLWSNEPAPEFAQTLEAVFTEVEVLPVSFFNPMQKRQAENTLYLATL